MPDDKLYEALMDSDEKNQVGYTRHLCELYLQDHPAHVPTLIMYASNLITLAQYSKAQAALDHAEALAHSKLRHFVIAQRGHLLEAQGDYSEAEIFYARA